MRNPVNSLRANLVRTVEETRERLAGERYELEAVRAALTKAAGEGFDQATIAGPEGVDLRETAAAKTALIWLGDMKLDCAWETRGTGSISSYDLVVSWQIRSLI